MSEICEQIPAIVWTTDEAGLTIYGNSRFRAYFGSEGHVADGLNALHPDDAITLPVKIRNARREGIDVKTDVRLRRLSGEYCWFALSASTWGDSAALKYCWVAVERNKRAGDNFIIQRVEDSGQAGHLIASETEILEMVARGAATAEVFDKVCRLVEELIDDCFCCILELSLDRRHFRFGAAPRLPGEFKGVFDGSEVAAGLGPCGLAATSRRSVEVPDCASDALAGTAEGRLMLLNGFNVCQAKPILSPYGNTAGVFTIYRQRYAAFSLFEQQVVDRAINIIGISIDRTRHEEALVRRETQVRRSQAQLLAAQRISSTGSFTFDIQKNECVWSEELYRIFDIDPSLEPDIYAVRKRVYRDDLDKFNGELQRALSGQSIDVTFRIVTSHAALKFLRGLAKISYHVGDNPVLVGTVQDITDFKNAQEALQRGEEALVKAREDLAYVSRVMTISALTASIAHEVSQPLAGILTNANACLRLLALSPPNIQAASETARRTIRDTMRATEIIKRLRAMFARQPSTMEYTDLNELAREVIILSARDMHQKSISVTAQLEPKALLIMGDRVQLQQVILNMLLNARDAMGDIESRPRILTVSTHVDTEESAVLSITDVGIGFPLENADKMFEAFFTTKQDGMGIGLAISRSIIENHGGIMWAEPNDGPGATVAFSIPLRSPPQ
ncbi:ATP-binding protein [Rhizobium laguerreae]|uniref:ATP-binding protein n=1 Tax=Rhizobium laguerreae TaxID=1076926 RepID=UPI001FE76302|nr:ATP-binding protein [Rhizobium laguerreae]